MFFSLAVRHLAQTVLEGLLLLGVQRWYRILFLASPLALLAGRGVGGEGWTWDAGAMHPASTVGKETPPFGSGGSASV